MSTVELVEVANVAANELLLWVGYGTIVGLAAKAVMPGKDPGGAVGTMMMGIAGALIGCGITALFFEGVRITPISWLGFPLATAGAFILLFFYKLLSGTWYSEAEDGERWWHMHRRSRRRRRMVRETY